MSNVSSRLSRSPERAAAPKQVRLRLVYIDFWSTVKLFLLFTISLAIVLIVATFLIWLLLSQLGVFESVGGLLSDLLGDGGGSLAEIGLLQVMLFALVGGLVTVIFGTALGAVGALLYNMSVRITGGLLVGFTNS